MAHWTPTKIGEMTTRARKIDPNFQLREIIHGGTLFRPVMVINCDVSISKEDEIRRLFEKIDSEVERDGC